MRRIYLVEGIATGYARRMMHAPSITQHPQHTVIEYRVKVLGFYDRYGSLATREAFGASRSTVYAWKQRLRTGHRQLAALAPGSRAPRVRRRRTTHPVVADFIVSRRTRYPRLGKDKLAAMLQPICSRAGLACPSVSTVGRILDDLKAQGRLPKYTRLSHYARTGHQFAHHHRTRIRKDRRGNYYPKVAGDLVQIDCVVKFVDGVRRYVISAIDYQSEFAFSLGYASLSSTRARDFLGKFLAATPFTVSRVQTDNGSEFYKLFHAACTERGLKHFWNYPRSPRMNAKIERYNRTIQEEFVDYHLDELAYDLSGFNYQLMDWLIWYNTERPHWTLKLKSPLQALLEALQLPAEESRMWWTDTDT